jgi:hypothetical protein
LRGSKRGYPGSTRYSTKGLLDRKRGWVGMVLGVR